VVEGPLGSGSSVISTSPVEGTGGGRSRIAAGVCFASSIGPQVSTRAGGGGGGGTTTELDGTIAASGGMPSFGVGRRGGIGLAGGGSQVDAVAVGLEGVAGEDEAPASAASTDR
jgi:hypothetical protein